MNRDKHSRPTRLPGEGGYRAVLRWAKGHPDYLAARQRARESWAKVRKRRCAHCGAKKEVRQRSLFA